MDKKLLEQIAKGEGNSEELDMFDKMAFSGVQKEPSEEFTSKVMQALPPRPTRRRNYQVWAIILGFLVAITVWGMEGFYMPQINFSMDYFGFDKSIEMNGMLQGFMMINAILVLLLIDRAVQRRKRFS